MENDHYTLQVAPEDCTGCAVCVDVCPVKSKSDASKKAINMVPQAPLREAERDNWDYFLDLPEVDRNRLSHSQVKDVQLLQPLFEFSGACAGCGETAYIKLLTQLFGDRLLRRQRHWLLLDLRRQPANHSIQQERDRPRTDRGPTRSSKITRNSASACAPRSISKRHLPSRLYAACIRHWCRACC